MHESSAFDVYEQKGRKEGRVEQIRRTLIRQGRRQFGGPNPTAEAELQAIDDIDRLERMADAVLSSKTWEELVATP